MGFAAREALFVPMLRAAFAAQGMPPEWGPAIARTESAFVVEAQSNSAGDTRRGGSWGLCQMSYKTALALGYKGAPEGLLTPAVNAALAAKLCRMNMVQFRVAALEDVAALYNSGKLYKAAPASTRTVYVPRVIKYAAIYRTP
jgi:soluble lytic murein transglycosylase-like protein